MQLTIPDDVLEQAGLDQKNALIEFACRLFDAGKLPLPTAARLANLSSDAFQGELHARNLSVFRPTIESFRDDMKTLRKLGV